MGEQEQQLLRDINRIAAAQGGDYPDHVRSPQRMVAGVLRSAQDSLAALRTALARDPEDACAMACGRLVSKAYGKHEAPHCPHHSLRSGTAAAHGSPGAAQPPSPTSPSAASQHGAPGWQGEFAAGGLPDAHGSPPSGPGFLLQREQQQHRHHE